MVKLKDIAEVVGVSVATVSKALSRSHEISIEMTERIHKIANEMGYIANSQARSLKTNRSYNVGVVYVDNSRAGLKHEYFSTMLGSIQENLRMKGYDFTFISNVVGQTKHTLLSHARYRRCDGVIIVTADFEDKEVLELIESDMSVVTIDHIFDNRTAIMSDNSVGLGRIVDYIYKQGHRKIAFIHGELTTVTKERLQSFHQALQKLNLEVKPDYIKQGYYHLPKHSGLATRDLLNLDDRPTCIIYPDDYSFMGGMSEIEKHGLKIPEDISVVGYDGIYLSRILRPILTTYIQDSDEIGKQAALKLIEQIEHPKDYKVEVVTVNGKLQQGSTVKKLD
ncbi:HTH-type transcriptional repressor CytR [Acholeplasma oculi]|uniref:Transcriptional regulator, LacI family n=1 Tax=Acholeplasma oculi TaxID=35623 RepID=A0A061AAN8_9MOLU|nr:LacI family DNA-binding transcriptional regulator [Acholeplasma oculi]CDR30459.1 Transcriptional regulator, LacI family [Acholeplasma oculi]SKC51142.1 transcriptional regulator, LacI family [Acholeplasma oculi]SUT89061.1 HTH-type transcriptional repressor CytR [Acholeplasma oculi]